MKPAISAHRRTTLAEFAESIAAGAEFIELDIRCTRDGEHIIHHDAETPGGLPVAGSTFAELQHELGDSIVRSNDVVDMLAGKAKAHIDLKSDGFEIEVVKYALDTLGAENFIATTLIDASVRTIKEYAPEVSTALSLGLDRKGHNPVETLGIRWSELFPLQRLRWCKADWVSVQHQLAYLNVLRVCAAHDIRTMVWFVNSDRWIKHFLRDERVDVLITDRPQQALELRSALQHRA